MLKLQDEDKPEVPTIPPGFQPVDTLPSKYKCYPKGTRLYARPLKVLELKQLATMSEETADEVINSVLARSTIGLDVGDLVVADKIFLIMWQRANTYKGDEFSISYVCPDCGKEDKYKFDVVQTSVSDVVDDYDYDKEYEVDGHKICLDQARVKSVSLVKEYLTNNPDADKDILASIAFRVRKVDGHEVGLAEAYEFCVNLSPAGFVKLNGLCTQTEMLIDPVVHVKCNNCAKEVPVRVSFRPDFFIPAYTGW